MEYSVRSLQEIEELKNSWQVDPCWDIEETPGYEVWHDELMNWRKDYEERCEWNEMQRVGAKCAELGINAKVLRYIERLEARILSLEEQVKNLE
jgi:hypothetical protein